MSGYFESRYLGNIEVWGFSSIVCHQAFDAANTSVEPHGCRIIPNVRLNPLCL